MRSSGFLFSILLVLLFASSTASFGAVDDGLVLYYSFDIPAAAGVIQDQSSFHNDGTLMNGAVLAPGGSKGDALQLDGWDDYVRVPAAASLNCTDRFSIVVFFNTANYNDERPLVLWKEPGPVAAVHVWTGTIGYQWQGKGTGAHIVDVTGYGGDLNHVISVYNPPANAWHMLVVTYDRPTGIGQLFLDGVLQLTKNMGSYVPSMVGDVYIGADPIGWPTPGDNKFIGKLDEIRIYGRVISAAEVAALYQGWSSSDPPYITLIGFSNDPEGDQDVTQFYRDETLYVRVRDVDLEADSRADVRLMLQQSRSGMRWMSLEQQEDGAFTGSIPLARFRPGPVRVFLQSNGKTRLMKDSALTILAE